MLVFGWWENKLSAMLLMCIRQPTLLCLPTRLYLYNDSSGLHVFQRIIYEFCKANSGSLTTRHARTLELANITECYSIEQQSPDSYPITARDDRRWMTKLVAFSCRLRINSSLEFGAAETVHTTQQPNSVHSGNI